MRPKLHFVQFGLHFRCEFYIKYPIEIISQDLVDYPSELGWEKPSLLDFRIFAFFECIYYLGVGRRPTNAF